MSIQALVSARQVVSRQSTSCNISMNFRARSSKLSFHWKSGMAQPRISKASWMIFSCRPGRNLCVSLSSSKTVNERSAARKLNIDCIYLFIHSDSVDAHYFLGALTRAYARWLCPQGPNATLDLKIWPIFQTFVSDIHVRCQVRRSGGSAICLINLLLSKAILNKLTHFTRKVSWPTNYWPCYYPWMTFPRGG